MDYNYEKSQAALLEYQDLKSSLARLSLKFEAIKGYIPTSEVDIATLLKNLFPSTQENEVKKPIELSILEILDNNELSISEIAESLNLLGHETTSGALSVRLHRMLADNKIASPRRGYYKNKV